MRNNIINSSTVVENLHIVVVPLDEATFNEGFYPLLDLCRLGFKLRQEEPDNFSNKVVVLNSLTGLHYLDDGRLNCVPSIVLNAVFHLVLLSRLIRL